MKPNALQIAGLHPASRLVRLRRWLGFAGVQQPPVVEVEFSKPHLVRLSTEAWVICVAGTAWLTQEGCLADTILSPGEGRHVSKADRALVVGMPRCQLRIVTAVEPAMAPAPQA